MGDQYPAGLFILAGRDLQSRPPLRGGNVLRLNVPPRSGGWGCKPRPAQKQGLKRYGRGSRR
jgi:hypothetical protein